MDNYVKTDENQTTKQTEVTAVDILNELRETVKLAKTRRYAFVAELIDNIIAKEFVTAEDDSKYSNAVLKIKEYIENIKFQCSLKYTHRILIVDTVLKELDGDT